MQKLRKNHSSRNQGNQAFSFFTLGFGGALGFFSLTIFDLANPVASSSTSSGSETSTSSSSYRKIDSSAREEREGERGTYENVFVVRFRSTTARKLLRNFPVLRSERHRMIGLVESTNPPSTSHTALQKGEGTDVRVKADLTAGGIDLRIFSASNSGPQPSSRIASQSSFVK